MVPRSAVSIGGGGCFYCFSRGFPVQLPKKGYQNSKKDGTPSSGGRSEANRAGFTSQLQPSFPEEAHLGKTRPHPHGLPYIPHPWMFLAERRSRFFAVLDLGASLFEGTFLFVGSKNNRTTTYNYSFILLGGVP